MKLSKTFLTGILALALVFGMTLAGCDNGSTSSSSSSSGSNPFIGGVWIGQATHYEFTNDGVYSTANGNTFNAVGEYEYTGTELTLRPTNGTPTIMPYEITNSLLVLNKNLANERMYTKNPKTGGGLNGGAGAAPLGGMWEDANGGGYGFNSAGEFFRKNGATSSDNKVWWDVHGTYEYNAGRTELTLRNNGMNGTATEIYTVGFETNNRVMNLTTGANPNPTRYNKRDDL
ncbi:MAG: hypothetical protein LBK63_03670 [Treponema sp.]|nr:hypothetical protein [Treponema sp.]